MNDNEYENKPVETEEQYEPELFSSQDAGANQNSSAENAFVPVSEEVLNSEPVNSFPENQNEVENSSRNSIFSRSGSEWNQMDFSSLPRTSNFANAESGVYQSARKIADARKAQDEEIPVCNIPLEKRNQLFAQPHVDLSQLPPPQSENVVTQRISDKILKKQPLVFSEKSPLPTRGGKPVEQNAEDEKENDTPIQNTVKNISLDPHFLDDENTSLGTILKTARQQAGLTEEQVSAITKISLMYICNIEKDDIDKELPYIFLSAYIQAMYKLYKLD